MGVPGTLIVSRDTPPTRNAPVDTGTLFVVGTTEKGKAVPTAPVTSLADFVTKYGSRLSTSILYDALEAFFREGGTLAYVGRVLGPANATATRTLLDGSAGNSLRVDANSPGAWGNSLTVQVTAGDAGGEFKIIIAHSTLGTLETSPSLVDVDAAVAWGSGSSYVVITELASGLDPAVLAASALSGGNDDSGGIVDASWQTALDGLAKSLGPGQVAAPGRTTTTGQTQLINHAAANTRWALIDPSDTTSSATLIAATQALKTLANSRYGMLCAPWFDVPGLTAGTKRAIPPSTVFAGAIARSESLGKTPNVPAGGLNGQLLWTLGARASFDDATLTTLNAAGVNMTKVVYGGLRIYGWRSLVDPNGSLRTWIPAGNGRLYMAIAAKAEAIAEAFVLREIDGRGRTISEFGSALVGMLLPFYEAGSLYGETSEEAFNVDVGAGVNTPATIANLELRAVLAVRMSPFAELVRIEIAKIGITESVG